MRLITKLRAGVGLAGAQLRHDRTRTLLAVLGIAFAVLSATLLASIGFGVIQTGEEKFEAADRDLWISGGPVRIAPGTIGGFEPGIYDVHAVQENITRLEGVRNAAPLLFQTVYIGSSPDDLDTQVAVGVSGGGGSVSVSDGRFFDRSEHYADGAYDGDRTEEIVIDPQTAAQYGLSVGDEVHIGGTVSEARRTTYTVVGVSETFTSFLGAPTVTMPLAELQSMTGNAHADQASMITVTLESDADVASVVERIESMYPNYDVRTNREQLEAVLAKQAVIIASGVSLVVTALVAGLALTVNLLTLLIYQQRHAIAAVRALGVGRGVITSMVASQALLLGAMGGVLGLLLTPPLVAVVDHVAVMVVGFEGLARTPYEVYVGGVVTAVGIGSLSAVVAAVRVAGLDPLGVLEDRA